MIIKICVVCGKELPKYRRICCSDICSKERKLKRDRERRNTFEYRKRDKERSHRRYKENSEYREDQNRKKREKYHNNSEFRENKNRRQRERYYNDFEYRENKLEQDRRKYRRDLGLPENADLHKESGLEIITREWLQENDIEFITQYYINLRMLGANWTHVDFFIEPNICLYSDGNYYHGSEAIQERDARINKALESGGYNVIRLSETEILNGIRPDLR